MTPEGRSVLGPRLVLGTGLSLVGILLALDNAELLDAGRYVQFWPAVLMAVGAVMILQARHGSGSIGGMILLGTGGWLLLNTLGVITVGLWDVFWPIVLILIGANLIRQTMPGRRPGGVSADSVNLMAILSGVHRSSASTGFRGGELFAVMGGCDLDLRRAAIEPGGEATIECFAMMGGIELRVPQTWIVDTRVVPIMGGIEDHTLSSPEGHAASPAPRLVLRGLVVMGGIEIKN